MFEESEDVAQELVFDGEEGGHFGFAAGFEGVGEGFQTRVGAAGDERGHGEDFAQEAVALVLAPRTLLPLWQRRSQPACSSAWAARCSPMAASMATVSRAM